MARSRIWRQLLGAALCVYLAGGDESAEMNQETEKLRRQTADVLGLPGGTLCSALGLERNPYYELALQVATSSVCLKCCLLLAVHLRQGGAGEGDGVRKISAPPAPRRASKSEAPRRASAAAPRQVVPAAEPQPVADPIFESLRELPDVVEQHILSSGGGASSAAQEALKEEVRRKIQEAMENFQREQRQLAPSAAMPQAPPSESERSEFSELPNDPSDSSLEKPMMRYDEEPIEDENWAPFLYWVLQTVAAYIIALKVLFSMVHIHMHSLWSPYIYLCYAWANTGLLATGVQAAARLQRPRLRRLVFGAAQADAWSSYRPVPLSEAELALLLRPHQDPPEDSQRPQPASLADARAMLQRALQAVSTPRSAAPPRALNPHPEPTPPPSPPPELDDQVLSTLTKMLLPLVLPLGFVAVTHTLPFMVAYIWVTAITFLVLGFAVFLLQRCDPDEWWSEAAEFVLQFVLTAVVTVFVQISVIVMTRVYAGALREGGYLDTLLEHFFADAAAPPAPCPWASLSRMLDLTLRWT